MSVRVEKQGPITTVAIDRPDRRNAVDRPTAEALAEAFLAFEHDDDAEVGVLAGAHGTFCAGADLKAVAEGGSEGNRIGMPEVGERWNPLATDGPMGPSRMLLSKPVIAAISGHAVAGGLELALWCDLRVAEASSVLGVYCRRFGVPLIDGGTVRLPRLIGHGHALDLILTGRGVGAEEAHRMGLVNRVVPDGRAREEAEALAREIARFPPTCMRNDRRSSYEQWALPFDRAMAREMELGLETLASGETVEGAARFRDGRGRGGRFDDL